MSSTSPPSLDENGNARSSNGGGWIGIDLGTTNCTASVWDISRSRCKVLRLGYESLARPPPSNGGSKGGKIVPSAVLFRNSNIRNVKNDEGKHVKGLSSLVGYAAIQEASTKNDEPNKYDCQHNKKGTLVTSFKRVVGITSQQAKELQSSSDFWNSLPFQPVILDATTNDVDNESKQSANEDHAYDVLGRLVSGNLQSSDRSQTTKNDMKEGIAIRIQSNEQSEEQILVTPLQVTTILLQSIRNAASDYLVSNNKSKIQTPGLEEEGTTSQCINNCIIGVPAHYSQAQRSAIQNAAKHAGFVGTVGTMTESTAATMAYGLFVSPTVVHRASTTDSTNDDNNDNNTTSSSTKDAIVNSRGKNILVFDMGGGTTDCTITNLDFGNDDKVQFRVVATSGDSHLGGDDVDELVARYVWKQHVTSSSTTTSDTIWKASEHNELISACRSAKEELCGHADGKDSDVTGMSETQVALHGKMIRITRHEFDSAIQQLIDRAECVVDNALSVLNAHGNNDMIHEVVLVGGSTHIPTIRSMLRRKFPPPPELCTSISAETAVAQGLAIQAALLSGVPLYELRNAMMLDVMPHSIGVWVHRGNGLSIPYTKGQIIDPNNDHHHHQGHFIEILQKDSPLPAMGCATFTLANINQNGVTVIAAEHIGPGDVYQCMGVFDFLLCRLNDDNKDEKVRNVKIGMTLETSGKFIVSIYDELDPDHREKLRTYLKKKKNANNNDGSILDEYMEQFNEEEEEKRTASCSGTEIALTIFCIVFFALYVAARVAFSDLVIPNEKADEL